MQTNVDESIVLLEEVLILQGIKWDCSTKTLTKCMRSTSEICHV